MAWKVKYSLQQFDCLSLIPRMHAKTEGEPTPQSCPWASPTLVPWHTRTNTLTRKCTYTHLQNNNEVLNISILHKQTQRHKKTYVHRHEETCRHTRTHRKNTNMLTYRDKSDRRTDTQAWSLQELLRTKKKKAKLATPGTRTPYVTHMDSSSLWPGSRDQSLNVFSVSPPPTCRTDTGFSVTMETVGLQRLPFKNPRMMQILSTQVPLPLLGLDGLLKYRIWADFTAWQEFPTSF